MKYTEMQPGIRYTVTKKSRHGEYRVGDSISKTADGCVILHGSFGGWHEPDQLTEACKGMECEVDKDFTKRKMARLQQQYKKLSDVL